jgi:hypothetical protein
MSLFRHEIIKFSSFFQRCNISVWYACGTIITRVHVLYFLRKINLLLFFEQRPQTENVCKSDYQCYFSLRFNTNIKNDWTQTF